MICRIDGEQFGKAIPISNMDKNRIGKIAICTQELENYVPWLEDWVGYHMSMGVNQIFVYKAQVLELIY